MSKGIQDNDAIFFRSIIPGQHGIPFIKPPTIQKPDIGWRFYKLFGVRCLSSNDLACSLCARSPGSNEEAASVELQQVHGTRIDSICLAIPHLQEVVLT